MRFEPSIFPKNYPPKGGWGLVGIPPGTPDDVAAIMDPQTKWSGDGYSTVINKVTKFLLNQRVQVTDDLLVEVWAWADAQWCAKSPERCKGKPVSKREASGKIGKPVEMGWVAAFWDNWNLGMAGNADPLVVNRANIALARTLIRGPYGCAKCAKHWEENLLAFPVDRAGSDITKARVWLWHVHNLTREGKTPTPYNQIAKRYGWSELESSQITAILAEIAAPSEA